MTRWRTFPGLLGGLSRSPPNTLLHHSPQPTERLFMLTETSAQCPGRLYSCWPTSIRTRHSHRTSAGRQSKLQLTFRRMSDMRSAGKRPCDTKQSPEQSAFLALRRSSEKRITANALNLPQQLWGSPRRQRRGPRALRPCPRPKKDRSPTPTGRSRTAPDSGRAPRPRTPPPPPLGS